MTQRNGRTEDLLGVMAQARSPLHDVGAVRSWSVPPATNAPTLSVVLPIFNEADTLSPVVEEIDTVLREHDLTFEVIAVDDGSRDASRDTLQRLAQTRAWLKVIVFRRNCGQAAAFDAGFRHATGRFVVTMDADGQNDPREIPAMLSMLEEGYDMVAGWRKNRRDAYVLRTLPSKIANWWIRKVTGTATHDLGCSLRVYRRHVTEELRLYGEMHRFITVLAEGAGARVAEKEVNHRPRTAGYSKYGIQRAFKVILDLTTVVFLNRFQTAPIYVFGGTGGVLLSASAALAAYVGYDKIVNGVWVHRNPLFLIMIMLVLVGVQLLATGLIAEMILRTYFESQGRRAYRIAATTNLPFPETFPHAVP